jgi:hypothetical protein
VKFEDHEAYHGRFGDWEGEAHASSNTYTHPHGIIMEPVFSKLHDPSSDMVGIIIGILPWDRYLVDLLPEGVKGIHCILKNTCGQSFTYDLSGNGVSTA